MKFNNDTSEYKQQVETIVTACCNVQNLTKKDLNILLMAYIQDESYNRSAIAEAEKKIKIIKFNENFEKLIQGLEPNEDFMEKLDKDIWLQEIVEEALEKRIKEFQKLLITLETRWENK